MLPAVFSRRVGGGSLNTASGDRSTIPGGEFNRAQGSSSFAAGTRAKADHAGALVWGDSSSLNDVLSSANHQATFRCAGGLRIFSNAGQSAGVTLAPGGSSWSAVCDRNAKENFAEVDPRQVLERIAAMPITTWNYRSQDASIRHMGPMAQDFHAAFAGA